VRPPFTALLLCLFLCSACGKQPPAADSAKPDAARPDAAKADADDKDAGAGKDSGSVTLKPEEATSLGIAAVAPAAVRYQAAKSGYGVVLSHDVIAQAVADVATARAAAAQSDAILARMQRLAGTPGADSAEARENAARQATVDAAALRLANAKSSAVLGQHPPWTDGASTGGPSATDKGGKLAAALAEGRAKLVRVTFPLGSVNGRGPRSLWLARLDAPVAGERWTAHEVWDAPADATMPGRSFFALLQDTDVGEGERLAWAAGDSEPAESGFLIPSSAVIASDGKYWYYLEKPPGKFTRTALDIGRPMGDGYFVKGAFEPGDLIVTSAAGLLLARETNPSTEAE
jgi:hypothetical protein